MGKKYSKILLIASPCVLCGAFGMFVFCLMMDFVAKGKVLPFSLNDKFLSIKDFFHMYGISYKKVGDILSSGLGILMTIVSMFVSMNKGIIDNSINLIYGIPRNNLPVIERKLRFKILRRVNYVMPGIMLICLVTNFYTIAYGVLIYSYVCLIINHCLYRCIFDKELNQEAIIGQLKKLLKQLKKRKENDKIEAERVDSSMFLEDVAFCLSREKNWGNFRQLLLLLLIDSEIEMDKKVEIFYLMLERAFSGKSGEDKCDLFQILRYFLNREARCAGQDCKISLICFELMFLKADEKDLLENAKWLADNVRRAKETYCHWNEKPDSLYLNKQNGLFLIFLERRITKHFLTDESWYSVLEILLRTGENTFIEEYSTIEYYQVFGLPNETETDLLLNNARSLRHDYLYQTKDSIIYSLLKS